MTKEMLVQIEKSKMLKEFEQMKILGGRNADLAGISMRNCKTYCPGTMN